MPVYFTDEIESQALRKVRIAADIEISRRRPGWFCLMFHHGLYLHDLGMFRMIYSLQLNDVTEPEIVSVCIGLVKMADGSVIWGACPDPDLTL